QFKLIVENPEKPVASGLQVTAFVEYRPEREEDLQDRLHLFVDDERVDIPLLGLMPCCHLQIEPEINFGTVLANSKIISKEISITNHGSASGAFAVFYAGLVLLNIEPSTGVVEPKSGRTVRVDICTDVPRVIREVIRVELEGQECTEVWIKAVVVEQVLKALGVPDGNVVDCIHFGAVYFGSSKTQQISLYNPSPECLDWVAVLEDNAIGEEMGTDLQRSADAALQELSLRRTRAGDVSTLLLCIPSQGTLLPYKQALVTLCFSPKEVRVPEPSVRQDYVLFLRLEAVGNKDGYLQSLPGDATDITKKPPPQLHLAVTGSGLPVLLTCKPGPAIKFMECFWGEQTQVVCTLNNESEFLPVTFSFHRTAHFRISPGKGRIQPKSAQEVIFSFCPHQIGTFKVKQVVDIIGKGLEKKNSSQVLKKKSFHQIYLSLIGVCKPKQNHTLFNMNPGISPVVSTATGQFVAAGRGEDTDPAPVAVLQPAQSHTPHTNRSCQRDALPAFPRDPAGSLRPRQWNQKDRTIFSRTERNSCTEPEFAYTASERLSRAAHKQLYRDFISGLRQHRLRKEATRQFYIYNNPVSIGLKPAEGLLSPKISLTELNKEKLQLQMLPWDESCLLTSQKLAAVGSKSCLREVRSGLSAVPSSAQEKEDCSLTLTSRQLHQILIGPSTIDFGDVCVYSSTVRQLHIINNLLVHIWVQIEMEMDELVQTSPLSQVVPPLTRTHIPIVFETETPGMFKRSFTYTINSQHLGHVLVVAKAVPAELQLSARELLLTPLPGYLAETEFRATVSIHNPRNHPAEFTWRPVLTGRATAFSIQPAKGSVEAYGHLECEVLWQPGFSSPEAGEFNLCVRRGNTVTLKCFAKVTIY
ncbi:CFA47 protein, partial [Bucco capensis]|nr:CFA47 protein [Bucco capensis]